MSYRKKTIKAVLTEIGESRVYLPALQRKFVWGKGQIELLFDSLMRNYPFGTFLFWRLGREQADKYVFYEFLKEYDERNPYNRRVSGKFLHEEIVGVLDGQQRLSALVIGFQGTHTEKALYKRKGNASAYAKTRLYLNLLSLPYTVDPNDELVTLEDQNFEFRFLTPEAAEAGVSRKAESKGGEPGEEEPMFWMAVGDVLGWKTEPEFEKIMDDLRAQCATGAQREAFEVRKRFVRRGLTTLHARVVTESLVNYFEVAKDDLEDILKIFVRVNSGGTVLSKTDLLFSTIVATWDDGRDRIEELLKRINATGDGFAFGNEFLMRCCLVLLDYPVATKVSSFRSENVEHIREAWPMIANTVERTVNLLVEFGFNGTTLSSQNATLLLAYYLHKGGAVDDASKEGMRKYLVHALINGIYGGSPDALITDLRNAFRSPEKVEDGTTIWVGQHKRFDFETVRAIRLPQQKSLTVTEEDIERLLETKKGSSSFWLLSLLYPQLRFNEVTFHQDHIHPGAGFSDEAFGTLGLSKDERLAWLALRDTLPNLQLMEGKQNSSKNAKPFEAWFAELTEGERAAFKKTNYLPEGVSLAFEEFIDFYERRKVVLREGLRSVLAIQLGQTAIVDEWERDDEEMGEESRDLVGAGQA